MSADELRLLTGDAVHTERRARELRDLGLQIETFSSGGLSIYVLKNGTPDLAAGARATAARNIRNDKALGPAEREHLITSLD